MLVATSVTVMSDCGTTPPVGSVTVPRSVAFSFCANRYAAAKNSGKSDFQVELMRFPSITQRRRSMFSKTIHTFDWKTSPKGSGEPKFTCYPHGFARIAIRQDRIGVQARALRVAPGAAA